MALATEFTHRFPLLRRSDGNVSQHILAQAVSLSVFLLVSSFPWR